MRSAVRRSAVRAVVRPGVGVVALCERVVHGHRGATRVLADYLNERGWTGFRIERAALDKVTQSLLDSGYLDEETLHGLACDYAAYLLPRWEDPRPDDPRPRQAISAKRAYLSGDADATTLEVARSAAQAASRSVDRWEVIRPRQHEAMLAAADTAVAAAMRGPGVTTVIHTVEAASRYANWWNLLGITARRLEQLGL